MKKQILSKYLASIAVMLFFSSQMFSQKTSSFDAAVRTVKKNVQCCSAFFPEGSDKATAVMIFRGGGMTIVYNNGRAPYSFNLFELYKDVDAPLGMVYNKGGRIVEFKIDATSSQAIRFNSSQKAQETYDQLLLIFKFDKENYRPQFSLNIQQTIDSVNTLLRSQNSDRAQIALLNDSTFKTSQMPSIRFDINVNKLKSSPDLNLFQVKGLSYIPHMSDGFAAGPRISFQNGHEQAGFLKFTSPDGEIPQTVHRLLIHLHDLMRKQ